MSTQHAPAPWWVTDGGVRNSGGYIAHTNSVQHYDGQDERYVREVAEREADKRLIAAAPDLLEALQELLGDMSHMSPQECLAVAKKARVAVAKATGGTS